MVPNRIRLGAAVAAAALFATMPTSVAQAAYPGRDGRIAFVKSQQIYTITPAGTGLKRLTTTKGIKPRWSPDGKRLAFLRAGDIWVMNADGSAQKRVTQLGNVGAPTWSPDGRWLAAVASVGLFKIRSTVPYGDPQRINAPDIHKERVSWSPDGTRIAYKGGLLDGEPCEYYGNCLSTVNVVTGDTRIVQNIWDGSTDGGDLFTPDWKPDASGLLFSESYYCGGDPSEGGCGDDPPYVEPLHVNVLQWSHDYTTYSGVYAASGGRIAFTKQTGSLKEIYTASATGTNWRRVTAGQDPDWQPL